MILLKKIISFLFLFTVFLLFLELYFRFSGIAPLSYNYYESNNKEAFNPSFEFVHFSEGFSIKRINKYGFFGSLDINKNKTDTTFRIALIGDSFILSEQVFERDYFGTLTQQILQKKYPKKKIEILNFGRSKSLIPNMYAYDKAFVDQFQPDLKIYFVVNKSVKSLTKKIPVSELKSVSDSAIVVNYFNNSKHISSSIPLSRFLIRNSALINMANLCLHKIKKMNVYAVLFDKYYYFFNKKKSWVDKDDEFYSISPVVNTIIERLDSSKVVLAYRGSHSMNPKFVNLCKKQNLRFIDLSYSLNKLEKNGVNPYYWKVTGKLGHWNVKAHKAVGEELAKQIIDLQLIK